MNGGRQRGENRSTERRGGFLATDSVFPCLFAPPLFLLLPSFLLSLLLLSIVRNHRFFFSLFFFSLTSCFPLDDGTRLYNVYIYAFLIFNFFDSRSIVQPSIRLQASFSFDIIIFPLLHSHPPLLPPPYPIILIVIFSSWKKKKCKNENPVIE